MERIRDRSITMDRKVGLICPRIRKLLDDRYTLSEHYKTTWNGADEFEVEGLGHKFIVNVRLRECTCRIWQLTGIPCAHSIPCIVERNQDPTELVDRCYHRRLFCYLYENVLHPTTSAEFWTATGRESLAPPTCVNQPGRPKKTRIRDASETSMRNGKFYVSRSKAQKCGNCGQPGHKRTTCVAIEQPQEGATTAEVHVEENAEGDNGAENIVVEENGAENIPAEQQGLSVQEEEIVILEVCLLSYL